MGFIDAIGTGIGKIALLLFGIFILIVGMSLMATNYAVTGLIIFFIGIGVMIGAKSYSR